jgi:hypothetical protein
VDRTTSSTNTYISTDRCYWQTKGDRSLYVSTCNFGHVHIQISTNHGTSVARSAAPERKRQPTEAAFMRRWLGCRSRRASAALLTPLASMCAQDQAIPVSRHPFQRAKRKASPLWRIAKTRLIATRHPHSAPTRPDPRLPALGSVELFKIAHMDRPIESMHKKFGQPKIQSRTNTSELGTTKQFGSQNDNSAGRARPGLSCRRIPRCNAVAPKRDGRSRCRAANLQGSSGAYHPPMSSRARIGL